MRNQTTQHAPTHNEPLVLDDWAALQLLLDVVRDVEACAVCTPAVGEGLCQTCAVLAGVSAEGGVKASPGRAVATPRPRRRSASGVAPVLAGGR
jgi:hypothetical protein